MSDKKRKVKIVDKVDYLNDEVKTLALNLAIYLSKAKSKSEEISRMEPEFVKLVNSTVKVAQEVAQIIRAAQNKEPSDTEKPLRFKDIAQLEAKLKEIVRQCDEINRLMTRKTDITA